MNIDLHNHTKRCNHAIGECEEYIHKAIQNKIDIFGFADHAPMEFDKKYRMEVSEIDSYLSEINSLKHKYKNIIDIRVGFEVDFIYNKEYLIEQSVINSNVDFLIGSVHFLNNWGFDNEEFLNNYDVVNINDAWIEYLESISSMAQSNLFDIVGHFDLLKIFNNKPSPDLNKYINKTLESIKYSGMAVEINTSGARKMVNEIYPSDDILKLICKMGIPITFGSDAHSPSQVGYMQEEARDKAKSIGFKNAVSFNKREMELFTI